jgi:small subunit ribosomal protein S1
VELRVDLKPNFWPFPRGCYPASNLITKVAKLTFHLYNTDYILIKPGVSYLMEQNDALVEQKVEPEQNQTSESPNAERPISESPSMESLLEEQGLSLDFPSQGEIRKGFIATIRDNEILVSIGTKSEGVISGRELESIPASERAAFKVGQEIPVYVVAPEDPNGNVVLSYVRAREQRDWEDVENLLASGESIDSKVIGYNKGGLIVPIGGLRGFVPASQISLVRRTSSGGDSPEQRWAKMVGDPMKVRVIEVDRERRRLILSERQALQETRETLKDRLLDELQEGIVRTGRVTSLADFGAFVNIEGADGLVHLSEISWERIQHPNEVLKVGQEVRVKVISVDRDRKRIGLSIRQLQDDPWTQKVSYIKEGMLVEGTITHLTKFGAFARLGEDLEGLIHVSELSEQRVGHPKEVVHEGEVVTLRVIKVDPERRRIGLSLRKVDSPAYADLDWKMALADEVNAPEAPEATEAMEVTEITEDIIETETIEDVVASETIEDIVASETIEDIVASETTEDIVASETIEDIVATETIEDVVATETIEDIDVTEITEVSDVPDIIEVTELSETEESGEITAPDEESTEAAE